RIRCAHTTVMIGSGRARPWPRRSVDSRCFDLGGSQVTLVVQKYGGSSVADAAGIKRVAKRIVDTRKAGHDVVVVVSAMGVGTDEVITRAPQAHGAHTR